MKQSLEKNKRIELSEVGLFADGVAVKQVGKITFELAKKYVDSMVTVNTDEICAAIKDVFGDAAYNLNVSSTKSMTGHLLGAGGALEAALCVKAIQDSIIPPTINLEEPDPLCDLDYTPNQSKNKTINTCMSNSFGFGVHNSVLIFSKHS